MTCSACGAGTFSPGGQSKCGVCDAGFFSGTRSGTCGACEPGTFSPVNASTSCTNCDAGTHSPVQASKACVTCRPGTYAPPRAALCPKCEAGKYTNASGTTDCTDCGAGTITATAGLRACTLCKSGRFQSEAGSTECRDCLLGTSMPRAGEAACSPCEVGKRTAVERTVNCESCPAGKYQAAGGQTECVDCEAGRFQKTMGEAFCKNCDEGFWSIPGSSRCDVCAEGFWFRGYFHRGLYINDDDDDFWTASGCEACPEGSMCGGGLCLPAPKQGYWSQGVDGSAKSPDILGFLYPCLFDTCNGVPPVNEGCYEDYHMSHFEDPYGQGDSTVAVEQDAQRRVRRQLLLTLPTSVPVFNPTASALPSMAPSLQPTATPQPSLTFEPTSVPTIEVTTIEPTITTDDTIGKVLEASTQDLDSTTCNEGSGGPLCAACSEGFFPSSATLLCEECASSGYLSSLINVFYVFLVAALIKSGGRIPTPKKIKRIFGMKHDFELPLVGAIRMVDPGQAKIIWSTIQVVTSVSWGLDMKFPEPFASFSTSINVVQLDFLNVDCAKGTNFHTNVYTTSAMPIVLMFMIMGRYYYMRGKRNLIALAGQGGTKAEEHAWHQDNFSFHFSQVLVVSYLFLPAVPNAQFKGLSCFEFDHGSDSYVKVDTSIDCNSDDHKLFIFYDSALIAIYQSMIFVYIYLLYMSRHKINPVNEAAGDEKVALKLRNADRSINHIRFLFGSSRCERWYHEVVDMYRRIFFIGVIPLIGQDPVIKAYIGAMASMVFMIYFRETSPFLVDFTNVLATVSQYQILFVYLAALFIKTGAIEKIGVDIFYLGCALIAVNSVVILAALYVGWEAYKREKRIAERRVRKALKIENAAAFSAEVFASTVSAVGDTEVTQSHVLLYYYTSLAAAKVMVKMGVPAFKLAVIKPDSAAEESATGVVLSRLPPHEMREGDRALDAMSPLSPSREVCILVKVPRAVCFPFNPEDADLGGAADFGDNGHADSTKDLVVVPTDCLTAFGRAMPDENEVHMAMKEWGVSRRDLKTLDKQVHELRDTVKKAQRRTTEKDGAKKHGKSHKKMADELSAKLKGGSGALLQRSTDGSINHGDGGDLPINAPAVLPRSELLRAFLLKDEKLCNGVGTDLRHLFCPQHVSAIGTFVSVFDQQAATKAALKRNKDADLIRQPVAVESCEEYLGRMAEIRAECDQHGLVVVYHYTMTVVAQYIFDGGFHMSTSSGAAGGDDGGVYFSSRGPASCKLGTPAYEEEAITDVFGADKIAEMTGKKKMNVMFVYGAEPRCLKAVPGGSANAHMFARDLFESLGEPLQGGDEYFLRPDRIFAAFVLDPAKPPRGYEKVLSAMEEEARRDSESQGNIEAAQRDMENNDRATRGLPFLAGAKAGTIVGARNEARKKKARKVEEDLRQQDSASFHGIAPSILEKNDNASVGAEEGKEDPTGDPTGAMSPGPVTPSAKLAAKEEKARRAAEEAASARQIEEDAAAAAAAHALTQAKGLAAAKEARKVAQQAHKAALAAAEEVENKANARATAATLAHHAALQRLEGTRNREDATEEEKAAAEKETAYYERKMEAALQHCEKEMAAVEAEAVVLAKAREEAKATFEKEAAEAEAAAAAARAAEAAAAKAAKREKTAAAAVERASKLAMSPADKQAAREASAACAVAEAAARQREQEAEHDAAKEAAAAAHAKHAAMENEAERQVEKVEGAKARAKVAKQAHRAALQRLGETRNREGASEEEKEKAEKEAAYYERKLEAAQREHEREVAEAEAAAEKQQAAEAAALKAAKRAAQQEKEARAARKAGEKAALAAKKASLDAAEAEKKAHHQVITMQGLLLRSA